MNPRHCLSTHPPTKRGGGCNPAANVLGEVTASDMALNFTDGITNPVRLWPERRLAVVGDVFHAFIYPAEQISDKVFGGHGMVSLLVKRF